MAVRAVVDVSLGIATCYLVAGMVFSKLIGLIFCNVLWSAAYAVSKNLMTDFHPMEVAFLRFFFAGVPLLIYCMIGGRRSPLVLWLKDLGPVDTKIAIVGLLTFYVSPLCQMAGLNLSRAVDGSLMIAIEPLFTILAAAIVLREHLRAYQVAAVAVALVGAGILTEVSWEKLVAFTDARLLGNLIFMGAMVSDTSYSVVSKPVLHRRTPVVFMTAALWFGVSGLFAHNLIFGDPARLAGLVPLITHGSATQWGSVLYISLACTSFAYLFWMRLLIDTPVSLMALTLYVQPVLGVAWGHFLLGETVTISTCVGAALILAAVWRGSR